MSIRHAFLGLALTGSLLIAGGATVLAGEDGEQRGLHGLPTPHADYRAPVVIEQSRTLRRIDRVLHQIEELVVATAPRRPLGGESTGVHGSRGRAGEEVYAMRMRSDPAEVTRGREDLRGRVHGHDVPAPLPAVDVERSLERMTHDLLKLREEIARAPSPHLERVDVARTISERDLREYVVHLRGLHFDSRRLSSLRDVAQRTYFTAVQAARIVDVFFGREEADAGFILYPRLIDPERMHVVYDTITFSSVSDDLRRRIRRLER